MILNEKGDLRANITRIQVLSVNHEMIEEIIFILIGANLGTHRFQRAGVCGKPIGSQSAPGIGCA